MNILASYNWIKEYLKIDLSAEEFARLTTAAGNSVERMDDVGKRFEHMVVGVVKKVKPHPNADKLRIVETDIGERTVDIVCGGENLAEGQRVAVGLPGAKVRWHGEGEFVELTKLKIRGVASEGMICAVEEIGFESLQHRAHDIWDLTALIDAKPGTLLAAALGLDDVVFDIEVTSNRPDCMSIIGQAREGAAAIGGEMKISNEKISNAKEVGNAKFEIEIKEPRLCPKYSAILIEGLNVGPSPWWLQKKLILAGHRPINNIVDVTNLVLHEYGQPLHAFDADTLAGEKIVVRKAKKTEKVLALDGKEYVLASDMLVIADAKKPIAVAGVMGGTQTGTTEKTTRVLLECATFDPLSVRRTARDLNLYSDSQLLFEKGLSTEATEPALSRAVELIIQVAGGNVTSKTVTEAEPYKPFVFPFDPQRARALMGIDLPEKDMVDILTRLGFEVSHPKQIGKHEVTVPYWRDHDIENSIDFVEEIARIFGYANIPSRLPEGVLSKLRQDARVTWELAAKQKLAGAGLTEVYSYAFVSEKQLTDYNLDVSEAVKLRNPLTVDHVYLRTSLIPSMLTTIAENQTRMVSADLFELAPIYLSQKKTIPQQSVRLLLATYGEYGASLFLRAKGMLERFLREMGIREWEFVRDVKETQWHVARSASICVGGKSIGVIGQISASVANAFGLDVTAVLAELFFEELIPFFSTRKVFEPLPLFPSVKRDLAFVVSERTEYASIVKEMKKTSRLLEEVELFDLYRNGLEEGKKSMAVHLSFRREDRTLEAKMVDVEIDHLREVLQNRFGAIMRS